jgi:hypothetical protein
VGIRRVDASGRRSGSVGEVMADLSSGLLEPYGAVQSAYNPPHTCTPTPLT